MSRGFLNECDSSVIVMKFTNLKTKRPEAKYTSDLQFLGRGDRI